MCLIIVDLAQAGIMKPEVRKMWCCMTRHAISSTFFRITPGKKQFQPGQFPGTKDKGLFVKLEVGVLASHKLWRLQFLNFSKQTLCVLESRFIVFRLPGKVIELKKLIIGTAGVISENTAHSGKPSPQPLMV